MMHFCWLRRGYLLLALLSAMQSCSAAGLKMRVTSNCTSLMIGEYPTITFAIENVSTKNVLLCTLPLTLAALRVIELIGPRGYKSRSTLLNDLDSEIPKDGVLDVRHFKGLAPGETFAGEWKCADLFPEYRFARSSIYGFNRVGTYRFTVRYESKYSVNRTKSALAPWPGAVSSNTLTFNIRLPNEEDLVSIEERLKTGSSIAARTLRMSRSASCLNLAAAAIGYSQSPKVLAEVERALAENPRPEYADALYKLFERNPNRLGDAATGLVWLRDKRVLPRLKKFADFERHPKLALSASQALGRFGSAEARPILERSLSYCKKLLVSYRHRRDSSLKVKVKIIERSLAMIDVYESKDRLNRLIEWIDSHRDATIAWAMVSIVRNSDDTTVDKIRKRIAELEQPRHKYVVKRLIDVLAALGAPLSEAEAKMAENSFIKYLARGLRPAGARPE